MAKKAWKKDLQRRRPYRDESIRKAREASVAEIKKEQVKRQEEALKKAKEESEKEVKRLTPPQLELPLGTK